MTLYPPLKAVEEPADSIEPVDCGTCPVTLACAAECGGNGYVFKCCHSTGVVLGYGDNAHFAMIDCMRHKFEVADRPFVREAVEEPCPLCSGSVLEIAENKIVLSAYWVPTVHAKFSVSDRLDKWRALWPKVQAQHAEEEERKRRLLGE